MFDRPCLIVEDLYKYFPVKRGLLKRTRGYVKAVDGVSFSVNAGECLAIVGESGCGKTTLVRTLLGLIQADKGKILFHSSSGALDVVRANRQQLLSLRREVQMVFQDPFSSLDPRMTVFDIVAEPLQAQGMPHKRIGERVPEVLVQAGLRASYSRRYPHQLSGGERQRVGIARALAVEPAVLLLDEPVSALDVSVRAQVLNLLLRLQQEMGLTYVFITHDLSVVKHLSDRIAVMYLGELVEVGDTRRVFQKPLHPYTEALMASAPFIDPEGRRERFVIEGDMPSPLNPPPGCRFSTRCRYVQPICREEAPALRPLAVSATGAEPAVSAIGAEPANKRWARCHFAEELELVGASINRARSVDSQAELSHHDA